MIGPSLAEKAAKTKQTQMQTDRTMDDNNGADLDGLLGGVAVLGLQGPGLDLAILVGGVL